MRAAFPGRNLAHPILQWPWSDRAVWAAGSEARRPPWSGPEVVGKLRSVVCGRMRSSDCLPYRVHDGNLQLVFRDVPRTSLYRQLLARFSYADKPDTNAPHRELTASTRCLFTRTMAELKLSRHTS